MIINGRSIPVLTVYIPGLKWEKNDLIYYSGDLYIVNSSYIGTSVPSNSPQCELYLKNHGPGNIVTSDTLITALSNLIDGLRPGGYLATITKAEFDDIKRNAVYQVYVNEPSIAPYAFRAIFRSYKLSSTRIMQELIDYGDDDRLPNLYYRSFDSEWSNWNPIMTLTSLSDESTFSDKMLAFSQLISQSVEDMQSYYDIVKVAPFKFLHQDALGRYLLGGTDCVVKIVLSYSLNGINYQEEATFDPTIEGSPIKVLGINTYANITKLGSGSSLRIAISTEHWVNVSRVMLISE